MYNHIYKMHKYMGTISFFFQLIWSFCLSKTFKTKENIAQFLTKIIFLI